MFAIKSFKSISKRKKKRKKEINKKKEFNIKDANKRFYKRNIKKIFFFLFVDTLKMLLLFLHNCNNDSLILVQS